MRVTSRPSPAAALLRIGLAIVVALSATLVRAPGAEAYLFNLRVGEDGSNSVRADEVLTVTGTSDLAGGEVCIVDVGSSAASCDSPAWGSPNQILTVGTFIDVAIEAPPLKPGEWKLIAVDRGGKSSEVVFEVVDCGATCNPGPARQRLAEWKLAAGATLPHHGALCVGGGAATIGNDLWSGLKGMKKLADLMEEMREVDNEIALLRAFGNVENLDTILKIKANLEAILQPMLVATSIDYSRGAVGGIFQRLRDETDGAWGGIMPTWYNLFDVLKPTWWVEESAWTSAKLFTNINCRAALMYSDIVADPPDSNYGTVVDPVFRFPRTLPSDGSLAELVRVTDEAQAYGTAARISVERLQGAELDGDAAGMRRQATAGADFNRQLVAANARMATLLDVVAGEADAHGAWQGSRRDSLADLDQWQRRAASGVVTAQERATLKADYGLTDADVDNVGAWLAEWSPATQPTVEQRWANHVAGVKALQANGLPAAEVAQLRALGATDADIEDLRIQVTQQSTENAELDRTQPVRMRALAGELREQAWPLEQFSIFLDMYAARTKTPVTPVAPTFVAITQCGQYGSVTLPTVTGLAYAASPADARQGIVVVTATALPGYVIASGAVARWQIDLGTYAACPTVSITAQPLDFDLPRGHYADINLATLVTASGPYSIRITKRPVGGLGYQAAPQTYRYRPASNFVGVDSFEFEATLNADQSKRAKATVTITVVDVNDPPVIEVVKDTVTINEGAHVPTPFEITDPNGDVISMEWRASNGEISTGHDLGPQFFDQGTGWVEVTATDARGATSDSPRIPVTVKNLAPSVTGTLPVRAVPGVESLLSISVSDPGRDDAPVTVWDFGDGTTATGTDVTKTWPAGTYTLRITATDKDGATTRRTSRVEVAPTVVEAGPDLDVVRGSSVRFDFTGSTPMDPWLTYAVDFGDGTFREVNSLANTRHDYDVAGDFTVRLRATDHRDGGREITDTMTVRVRTATRVIAHAVPGSVRGGTVDVQATVWDTHDMSVVIGADVRFSLGGTTVVATTNAEGRAVARLSTAGIRSRAAALGTVDVAVLADGQVSASTTSAIVAVQNLPAGDIVFLVDESGSMSPSQEAVQEQVSFIGDQIAASMDYTLALWGFGFTVIPRIKVPAVASLVEFKTAVEALQVGGAGTELGTDAIVDALGPRNGWRTGAGKCLVLVADEQLQFDRYDAAATAAALDAHDAVLFSITTPGSVGEGYRELAVGSGGSDFNIDEFVLDPAPVLAALLQSCATRVAERPDLGVTIDDHLSEVVAGEPQAYVVTAANTGAVAAAGTTVGVTLPAGVTVVDAAGGTLVDRTLTWQVGALAPGAPWARTFVVRTAADHPGGELLAKASVADDGSFGADPTPADTVDEDVTVVRVRPPDPSPTASPSVSVSPSVSPSVSVSPSESPSPSGSASPSVSPSVTQRPTTRPSPPNTPPAPRPSRTPGKPGLPSTGA